MDTINLSEPSELQHLDARRHLFAVLLARGFFDTIFSPDPLMTSSCLHFGLTSSGKILTRVFYEHGFPDFKSSNS